MKAPLQRVLILSALAVLCAAGVLLFVPVRPARVVFSNGSWLSVRKVTYGKNNVYYHDRVRRAAAVLFSPSTWDRFFAKWAGGLGVSNTDSCETAPYDCLVVFGDFSFVQTGTRFWEFTVVDAKGNESGPLETTLEDISKSSATIGPCILADGTNVPTKWPITLRIYEREASGSRKALANVPVKRGS